MPGAHLFHVFKTKTDYLPPMKGVVHPALGGAFAREWTCGLRTVKGYRNRFTVRRSTDHSCAEHLPMNNPLHRREGSLFCFEHVSEFMILYDSSRKQ